VVLSQGDRLVPAVSGSLNQLFGAILVFDGGGKDGEPFVLIGGNIVGCTAMISHDTKHACAVSVKRRERPKFTGHLCAGRVTLSGQDRSDGSTECASLLTVIGQPQAHQHSAEIGISESQCAVLVGEFGDFSTGVGGHQDADLKNHRPDPGGMAERLDVESPIGTHKLDEVEGSEVASRIVEEHVFGAGIGSIDASILGASMPLIDGGIELDPGVSAGPCCPTDLIPKFACGYAPDDLTIGTADQIPLAIAFEGLKEGVGYPNTVVGILSADGGVGFAFPTGVKLFKLDAGDPLVCQLDHAHDRGLGDGDIPGCPDRFCQFGVTLGIDIGGFDSCAATSGEDRLEMLRTHSRAGDESGDLLFLPGFPGDETFDVWMVEIEAYHFGCPAGGAATLDRSGSRIADLQK